MTPEYTRQCAVCGETFTARRSDARYCSAKCRVAAKRKRDAPPTEAPAPGDTIPYDMLRDMFLEASDQIENDCLPPNEDVERSIVYRLSSDQIDDVLANLRRAVDLVARDAFGLWEDRRAPTADQLDEATKWTLGVLMDFFTQHTAVTSVAPVEIAFNALHRDQLREWHALHDLEFEDEVAEKRRRAEAARIRKAGRRR